MSFDIGFDFFFMFESLQKVEKVDIENLCIESIDLIVSELNQLVIISQAQRTVMSKHPQHKQTMAFSYLSSRIVHNTMTSCPERLWLMHSNDNISTLTISLNPKSILAGLREMLLNSLRIKIYPTIATNKLRPSRMKQKITLTFQSTTKCEAQRI